MLDIESFGMSPDWRRAITFFDAGETSKVAELILSGVEQSQEVRHFLADVVTGTRRPGRTDNSGKKLLTPDHIERLHCYALFGQLTGQKLKRLAVKEVATLSGAQKSTVEQAWKHVNRRWAELTRKNRRSHRLHELSKLAAKNNLFSGR